MGPHSQAGLWGPVAAPAVDRDRGVPGQGGHGAHQARLEEPVPAGPSLPGPRLTGLAETGSQCRRRAQGSARSGPPARGSSTPPPPLPPPPRPAPRPPLPHFPQEMINSGRGAFPWQQAREGARAVSRTRLPRAHAPSTPTPQHRLVKLTCSPSGARALAHLPAPSEQAHTLRGTLRVPAHSPLPSPQERRPLTPTQVLTLGNGYTHPQTVCTPPLTQVQKFHALLLRFTHNLAHRFTP